MTEPHPDAPSGGRLPAAADSSWRLQLGLLTTLALVSTLVFWVTDLDLEVAGRFYDAAAPDNPWPGESNPLWQFFYYGAPVFTAMLALGALATLLLGLLRGRFSPWRRPAALFLLTLVLGPGLLVNLVFKENWGRPRPRQVEQFAGDMHYLPPLQMGQTREGKSFVAGHASVGFSLFAFWFVWWRRRPRLAWAFLGAASLLGLTMGLGRMAAGAHFLSDVLWSGYITFFSALLLHYFVLRERPATDEAAAPDTNPLALIGYALLGGAMLLGSLVSLPVTEDIYFEPTPGQRPLPADLVLDLDRARLDIHLLPPDATRPLQVTGTTRGFGLPTYQIKSRAQRRGHPEPGLHYRLRQQGFFAELDTRVNVRLSASEVRRLRVKLGQGDIRVYKERGAVDPRLELKTGKGEVRLPAGG